MLWYTFRDIWQVPEKLHQAKNSVKTGVSNIVNNIDWDTEKGPDYFV